MKMENIQLIIVRFVFTESYRASGRSTACPCCSIYFLTFYNQKMKLLHEYHQVGTKEECLGMERSMQKRISSHGTNADDGFFW